MENILQFLERDKNGPRLKIAVLGDSMIDEYFDVQVKRISPEYPIPILQSECNDPQVVWQF
jgi:bifunctional ADP-heptose synthase (sugar kinase/adenylyltransferase)